MESFTPVLFLGSMMTMIYVILVILIPVFLYSAQRGIHKSYRELKEINQALLNLPKITTNTQIIAEHLASMAADNTRL